MRLRIWLIIIALLLGAATTVDPELAAMQGRDARVATIAWRLQSASVGLCRTAATLPGFNVHSLAQYAPGDRARVKAALGLDGRPTVLAVVQGSAADKAGLRAGDAIMAIMGQPTGDTLPAQARYDVTGDAETRIETALAAGGPLVLDTVRGGRATRVTIAGDSGCASQVQLIGGRGLVAQADGLYVQLSEGAVALAGDDDGLAALMAHELAHNFLEHRARLDAAKVSRGIFAGFGKGGALLRASEFEADRLSVWIVARGGYSLDAIVPFWQRWARRTDLGPLNAPSHPGWKDRLARIDAAIAEVRAQQAAGQPLVPAQ